MCCISVLHIGRDQEHKRVEGEMVLSQHQCFKNVSFEVGSEKLQHILVSKEKALLQFQLNTVFG